MRAIKIVSPPFSFDDSITLDEQGRTRRRFQMTTDGGISFTLDLPTSRLIRHGEGLELEDGRIIEVRAEPEPLYELTTKDPQAFAALAWQLGNRHLQAQIFDGRIFIRRDHVIKEMVIGLGANVEEVEAPFDPQTGAYDQHTGHAHKHS
ncbi:urease accessory protein UreE [Hyphococcus lacteus]|uniref:Urease accessory protein UreE n=1 Tax=Hyphococcus lacteus TaxID=3143536 RepID=A0ABV3Z4A0_9PROT